jgi:hypothetical protein
MRQPRGRAMKRIIILLVSCLIWIAVPIEAQQSSTLSSLEISLWPEYDRPDLLVIYRGQFAEGTPLPVQVDLRLPPGVVQPHAVAFVGEDAQRFNQEYSTRVEGDRVVVSFELSTLSFQMEYYTPLPVDASGQREFTYSYTADYPISALSLEVQVPPTADAFAIEPPADSTIQGSGGLTYELIEAGPLAQGETQSWTFRYHKSGSELTADSQAPAQSTGGATTPAAQSSDGSTIIIFAVSFVALVAVGAGAFWLGKQTQPASPAPVEPRGKSKRRGSGGGSRLQQLTHSARDGEEAFFCHQCGAALRPDSEFCHKCGTQVRA